MFKVLLVDDEVLVTKGLQKLIDWEAFGFSVCGVAEDGAEALELLKREKCELIITDIRMPEVDGLELIRRAGQELDYKPRFIVLSAYNDFLYAQTAMRYNVRDYILKPIDEEMLAGVLQRMQGEIREEYKLQSDYDEGREAVVTRSCLRLVRGQLSDEELLQTVSLLQLKEGREMYCLLLELADDSSREDGEGANTAAVDGALLRQSAGGLLGEGNLVKLFQLDERQHVLLADADILGAFHRNIKELALELYRAVVVDCRMNACLFVGKPVMGAAFLKDSLQAALQAREYKILKGDRCILFYEDIRYMQFKYSLEDKALFHRLEEAVQTGREKEITAAIELIFSYFHTACIAPECIKASIINFGMGIVKVIEDRKGNTDIIIKQHTQFFKLDGAVESMTRLKRLLTEFCLQCASYMLILAEKQTGSLKYRIEEYMKQNFRYDINIKTAAAALYMNPAYLGQVFRKSFGMYFHDYLNLLRMEEARKLLCTTDFKVYEIAGMVGYTNADYFSSKFEAIVGMTPLQYRKSS